MLLPRVGYLYSWHAMTTTMTPTATAGRDKQTRRRKLDDAQLINLGRDRDLSTAPAWIGLPDLSGVDLVQTQSFPVDKKARPRKRRWGEDWRELVIGASPYNRVSERSPHSLVQVVCRVRLPTMRYAIYYIHVTPMNLYVQGVQTRSNLCIGLHECAVLVWQLTRGGTYGRKGGSVCRSPLPTYNTDVQYQLVYSAVHQECFQRCCCTAVYTSQLAVLKLGSGSDI